MNILHPESLESAVMMKGQYADARYLAGGTAVLSLIGGLGDDASLIDISRLLPCSLSAGKDGVLIGSGSKLSGIAGSALLPGHIRQSAMFQSALQLRAQATIGGNIALSRFDSYMIPALYVSDAVLFLISPAGRRSMKIDEYILSGDRDSIIESILVQDLSEGKAVRFARSSHAHAALTAAQAAGRYAYAVSGSGFAFGDKDSYSAIDYRDDLAGSGAYKRYLASVCFGEAAL